MFGSIPKPLSSPLLIACLAFLAGCATGPAHYASSDSTRASFQALQTTDPAVQAARFGAYAKAAGRFFVGTLRDGRLAACAYRWEVPGVVLEEHCPWPYNYLVEFQYNSENRKLDVYNLLADRAHIRELTVLPDGSVEWPTALLGLEPMSRVTLDENGALDKMFPDSGTKFTLRDVSRDEFDSVLADARAQRASDKREKARSSREFWNAVSKGLGAASSQLQAENEARQMREAEQRSAIMRAKDAELRAMDRRLAEQQREAESKAQQQRAAAAKEREQSTQRARDERRRAIAAEDTAERDRKLQREKAELKQQAAAEAAASRQRRAESKAREQRAAAAKAREQSAQSERDERRSAIIVEDDRERRRKFEQEQAELERQAAAEAAASRQRQAQAKARSAAEAAALRAELQRRAGPPCQQKGCVSQQ